MENKNCFVIMPISDTDGYDEGHFNRVYKHLIKPACEEAGFKPIRADDISKANMIMIDILQKILECDMAICDLSSRNPNVFYELGLRQAFNKKTVLIKDTKTTIPFDISGIRTLSYNESLRIDEVKTTISNIVTCINETFTAGDKDVSSLLQLLSIKEPATLLKGATLSAESNIILNEIRNIKNLIATDSLRKEKISSYSKSFTDSPTLSVKTPELAIHDPSIIKLMSTERKEDGK